MLLDLGRLETKEQFSFRNEFSIETEGGGTARCRAEVEGTVARRGGRLFLEASIESIAELECSRCLEDFELRLDIEFDLVFHHEGRTEVPDCVEEEDFILLTDTVERRFDIFPRVRELILLELPIRSVCSTDCKGLCSSCGENLNSTECSCFEEKSDSRWDVLKKLLSKEDQS